MIPNNIIRQQKSPTPARRRRRISKSCALIKKKEDKEKIKKMTSTSYNTNTNNKIKENLHDSTYEPVNDKLLGSGSYGLTKLMREKSTGKQYAIKYIERGDKITEHVRREIVNHRNLNHPNVVKFRQCLLTPTHLAVAMEAVGGGELFSYVQQQGKFNESQARYFFQHLISGVEYLHNMRISHRDLKLENTLVDLNETPTLKICDFGFSKGGFDSQPKTQIGTPAYIAPEVYAGVQPYDGQASDVWACGVLLYVTLVGRYPFQDPKDPGSSHKMMQRVLSGTTEIPSSLSEECKDLMGKIFVTDPKKRASIEDIYMHPWFRHDLSPNVPLGNTQPGPADGDMLKELQSLEEINAIVDAAKVAPKKPKGSWGYGDDDDDDCDHMGGSGDLGGSLDVDY